MEEMKNLGAADVKQLIKKAASKNNIQRVNRRQVS